MKETFEQIDQNNPVTRGSTALAYKKETLSGFEEGHKANLDWLEQNSNQTKQETTLEEVAERKFQNIGDRLIFEDGAKWQQEQYTIEEQHVGHTIDELRKEYIKGFNEGSVWQQERSYSEEEVNSIFYAICKHSFFEDNVETVYLQDVKDEFEQFKNKEEDGKSK